MFDKPLIPAPLSISESIIASAKVGTDQAQPMSDIEKAARAIVTRMGFDPDVLACNYAPRHVSRNIIIVPPVEWQRPLWTFFTAEAEAALSVLDI